MVLFRPVLGAPRLVPALGDQRRPARRVDGRRVLGDGPRSRTSRRTRRVGLDAPDPLAGCSSRSSARCSRSAVRSCVVRRWLERFGIYVVAAVGALDHGPRCCARATSATLWRTDRATGGLPFWLAVDLVIVMPVSWLPLVGGLTRGSRAGERGAAAGTLRGATSAGNAWFYALGVLLVLAAGASADVIGIGTTIVALAGGGVVLLALLVGESDNAFADIYSAAVSVAERRAPDVPQRRLIVGGGRRGVRPRARLHDATALRVLPVPDRFGVRPALRRVRRRLLRASARPLRRGRAVRRADVAIRWRRSSRGSSGSCCLPLVRADGSAGVGRRRADARSCRLALAAVPAVRLAARREHPELRGRVRARRSSSCARVGPRTVALLGDRAASAAAARRSSSTTAGSSDAFVTVSSDPGRHERRLPLLLALARAVRPGRRPCRCTTRSTRPSRRRRSVPSAWLRSRQTTSDHR